MTKDKMLDEMVLASNATQDEYDKAGLEAQRDPKAGNRRPSSPFAWQGQTHRGGFIVEFGAHGDPNVVARLAEEK